jgi:UTP--glucose-1-phosphate uridylyltransferase|tara:strand:+ start:2031 stop:2861 length:831 start_codon:yes stop_codon:yes gene_type:complete
MINKCLFPAAGYGTRFLPVTKSVPKEMLPILTKPLLQYAVEEALLAGISNMAIVTGKGKRAIEDHFDNAYELESQLSGTSRESSLNEINNIINKSTFTYIRQKQMLGLGHAILTGEPLIGEQPFAVILADDLCECPDQGLISKMLEIFNQYKCSVVAIKEVPLNQTKKYGIVSANLLNNSNDIYEVNNMVEKPDIECAPSNLAIVGRYILTPDIFNILKKTKPDKNGELQITDALNIQAKKGKLLAYKFKGTRFDCGSVRGYLDANNHFAKKIGLK